MTASLYISARSAALVPSPVSLPEAWSAMLRGAWQFAKADLQATRAPSGSRFATLLPDSSIVHVASRCTGAQLLQGLVGGQQPVPAQPGRPPSLLGVTAQLLLHRSGNAIQLPSLHRISLQRANQRLPRGFCSGPASGATAVVQVRILHVAA